MLKTENVERNDTIQVSDEVVTGYCQVWQFWKFRSVIEMAGGFAGEFQKCLVEKRIWLKELKVEINEKSVVIDVNIIVEYGSEFLMLLWEIQKR